MSRVQCTQRSNSKKSKRINLLKRTKRVKYMNTLVEKNCPSCNSPMSNKGYKGDEPHTYYLQCPKCFISIPVQVKQPITILESIANSEYVVCLVKGLDELNPILTLNMDTLLLEEKSHRGNRALDLFNWVFIRDITERPSGVPEDEYCFSLIEKKGLMERRIQNTHYISSENVVQVFNRLKSMRENREPEFVFSNFPECYDKFYRYFEIYLPNLKNLK